MVTVLSGHEPRARLARNLGDVPIVDPATGPALLQSGEPRRPEGARPAGPARDRL